MSDLLYSLGLDITDLKTSARAAKEQTDDIKRGFKGFKDVLGAGGVAVAVLGFFREVIDYAQELKGPLDENTAAVKRFGDSIDASKKTAMEWGAQVLGVINRAGEGLGLMGRTLIEGTQNAWAALKNGDGFAGIIDGYKKGFEDVRRVHLQEVEVSKELVELEKERTTHAEEFKKVTTDLARIKEQSAAFDMRSLTAQEQVNALANQLLNLQREQAGAGEDKLRSRQLEVKIAQTELDLAKARTSLEKEISEVRRKNEDAAADAALKERDALRDSLSLQERRKAVLTEIQQAEADIARGRAQDLDVTQRIKRLEELRTELRDIQSDQDKANLKIAELRLKGVENLTEAEKLQLDLLEGVTDTQKVNAEIATLITKQVSEGLNPAEEKRLRVLTGQTEEIEKQNDKYKEQEALVIKITRKSGKSDEQLTDRELREKMLNLQQQIFDTRTKSDAPDWLIESIVGAYETHLKAAQAEYTDRFNFRSQAAAFGEDYALSRRSAFEEERYRSYNMTPDERSDSKLRENIQEIADRLSGRKDFLGAAKK